MDELIVRATAADVDACLAVHRAAAVEGFKHVFPQEHYPFPEDAVRRDWLAALTDAATEVYLALDGGRAVGTVCVGNGYLQTLYVLPSRWGHGVGGRLHDHALERLRSLGAAEARLWTLVENHQARAFYERRGWQLTGETRTVPFPPYPLDVEYAVTIAPAAA